MKIKNMKMTSMIWPTLLGLVPIVIGLLLYRQLPDKLPIHWGINGQADNYLRKSLAIWLSPLLLVVLNIGLQFALTDRLGNKVNPKLQTSTLWLLPILSLVVNAMSFAEALGYHLSISIIVMVIVGIIFIILGNYIPKTSQNWAVGFRFNSTLSDPDNWQKTNRLGGRLLVLSGMLCIISGIIGTIYPWLSILICCTVLAMVVVVPLLYSVRLAKKQDK